MSQAQARNSRSVASSLVGIKISTTSLSANVVSALGIMALPPRKTDVGARLGDMKLPKEALVVSVLRGGNAMIPNAGTTFELNDVVLILIPSEWETTLREFVA